MCVCLYFTKICNYCFLLVLFWFVFTIHASNRNLQINQKQRKTKQNETKKMAPTLVETILRKDEEDKQQALELVSVRKEIDLVYDLRHLAAFDENEIEIDQFRKNKDDYIATLTRDNAQLVVNRIFEKLRTKRVDNVVVAELPKQSVYALPRGKPVPKPRAPTKWQQYAAEKGIQKRKKDKLVWDEAAKEWKPRYGYHGINQQNDQWLIEVPDQKDPNVDYFAKQADDKKERVAKNELQRLRNIARASKLRLPGTGGIVPNTEMTNRIEIEKAKDLVKHSTASLGKFVDRLPDEAADPPRGLGKKRKFAENTATDLAEERTKNISIVDQVLAENRRKKSDDFAENLAENKIANKKGRGKNRNSGGGDGDDEDIGDRFDRKNRSTGSRRGAGNRRGGRGRGGARDDAPKKRFKKGPSVGGQKSRGGGGARKGGRSSSRVGGRGGRKK